MPAEIIKGYIVPVGEWVSSMRPRARARGNSINEAVRRVQIKVFNEAAGTCPRKWRRIARRPGRRDSSMRPRARARGNYRKIWRHKSVSMSSMRPRARARGNAAAYTPSGPRPRFFNEAAGTCPRKFEDGARGNADDGSSMRPRARARGNVDRMPIVNECVCLQ